MSRARGGEDGTASRRSGPSLEAVGGAAGGRGQQQPTQQEQRAFMAPSLLSM